jgi:ketosteroid isomerase-like protein
MKFKLFLFFGLIVASLFAQEEEEVQVNNMLDSWHLAAAEAKFDAYFNLMTPDAIFIGTDVSENWSKETFMEFCKPYFDRGKAWDFTAVQRNVYFSDNGEMAWFDEVLNTWMQLCRGSGVLIKTREGWQIKHYVLSVTVPNETIQGVIDLKQEADLKFMSLLKAQD